MNFRSRFPIWLWMISCERVDFFLRRWRCFVQSIVEVLGPNHVLKPVLPQQAPMGSQKEQRMSTAEDQPDIQQVYIERLGKRRQLISTNVCALPYPSREVMRGVVFLCRCACFNCSILQLNCVCLRLVAEHIFWQTYHQLELSTFFWGGMILIVAWLLLFTFFNYIYYLHILCIYVYIVMWYVCL